MALVPATITFTFTAQYVGCHRVCYRLNNSGGYTCVNTTCTGGGAPCIVPIAITVDNETCPTVEFDGYAQACCEDVSSLTGRLPFSATFVPSPSCKRYLATCGSASLFSIAVTNGGSGYAAAPAISFSGGGGGAGAAAHSTIGTGFITSAAITNAGGGYVNPGTYLAVPLTGSATGAGAQATITIAGGVVTLITITNVGNGYRSTDVLSFNAAVAGGNTVNAAFSIVSDYQKVLTIVLDNVGTGYTTAPTVIIAPGGINATATAALGYCSPFTVNSCTGNGAPVGDNMLQPGQSVDFCTAGVPPAPANYTITQDTGSCLCNCTSTTLTATGASGNVQYRYTLCNGAIVSGSLSPTASPSSFTVCCVTGSMIIRNVSGATGTITTHGAC
jgi:hypothetical protein